MSYEATEVVWITCGILFALGQAVIAILVTCVPEDLDKAIQYIEWIINPLDSILICSFASLSIALGITWMHFFSIHDYSGIVVCLIITAFACVVYLLFVNLIRTVILEHLRPE